MSLLNLPVYALVPARGGSRGIPQKNLRTVGGESLVEKALKIALGSSRVDHTYLSSDDEDILNVGRKLSASVIKRPSEFSSDTATAEQVVSHFLEELSEETVNADAYVAYLQPTSPLRTVRHLDCAFDLMEKKRSHLLVSVSEMEKSPFKSFILDNQGLLKSLFEEKMSNLRRQDLPRTFNPNGAIYVFKMSDFLRRKGFPSNGAIPFIMSREESIDVDTELDLRLAEQILGEQNGRV